MRKTIETRRRKDEMRDQIRRARVARLICVLVGASFSSAVVNVRSVELDPSRLPSGLESLDFFDRPNMTGGKRAMRRPG